MIRLTLLIVALALCAISLYGSGLPQDRPQDKLPEGEQPRDKEDGSFCLDPGEDDSLVSGIRSGKDKAALEGKLRRKILEIKRQKYIDQLTSVERQIDELRQAGLHQQAEQMQQTALVLLSKIDELDPNRQAEMLEQQITHLKRSIDDLHARGHHEEAILQEKTVIRLGNELIEFRRHISGPDTEISRLKQRLQHIRTAADNLRAAGMHKDAAELDRSAGQIEKVIQSRLLSPAEFAEQELSQQVQELNSMVHELRAEVRELKIVVQELQNRVNAISGELPKPRSRENLKALGYTR